MNKPKPKILYFITKSNWGGAQKYVYDLATSEALLSQFEVKIYAGISGNSNILFEKIEENPLTTTWSSPRGALDATIKTARLNLHNDFNIWKSLLNLFEFYEILKDESPDVIHVNSSKISVMMTLVARTYNVVTNLHNMVAAVGGHHRKNIRIIFTAHGWPHSETHRSLLWRLFTQFFMVLTVVLSHKTIFVSRATRDALFANKFLNNVFKKYLDKKSVIIHNGVSQSNKIALPKLRETIDSPHYGKINLVSIGDYHPNKGHDTVIKYMNSLDNMNYHIIGNGEWRAHLESMIAQHNLHDRVHLIHIPENAAHVLSRYDIYLQPSRKEGFSIAIPEALNAGLPVIARDVGGVGELIQYDASLTPNPSPIERGSTQTQGPSPSLPPQRGGTTQAALTLYNDDYELIEILKKFKRESLINYHEWLDERFSIERMVAETVKLYK